jgi:hypothetical protein
VIERGGLPGACRMTLCAGVIVVSSRMIWIGRRAEIRLMTTIAVRRQTTTILTVGMTLTAGRARMRAG